MPNRYKAKNPNQPWGTGRNIYVPTVLEPFVISLIDYYKDNKVILSEDYPNAELIVNEMVLQTVELRGAQKNEQN